ITMRELIDYAGGMVSDRPVKFFVPGGSSVPLLTPEHLDVPLTYEDMAAHGTMLGTGTPMVFDTSRSVTQAVVRWIEFYKHESCGKCTPCREGTYFMVDILKRLEKGKGEISDLDLLVDISAQISGRSFCALGDAAATPIPAALKYFREEFETKLVGAK
ncbi:MAG: NADH-quinone oxidoreductase subunit NuoF, partial [Actinomycetota bacterium]